MSSVKLPRAIETTDRFDPAKPAMPNTRAKHIKHPRSEHLVKRAAGDEKARNTEASAAAGAKTMHYQQGFTSGPNL